MFNNILGTAFPEHPVLGAGSQQVKGALGSCAQVEEAGLSNKHRGVGNRGY